MFHDIYSSLKQGFQQSLLSILFRYTQLARLLQQDKEVSLWTFFQAYFSSWWWTRWWFKTRIPSKTHQVALTQLIACLDLLKTSGLYEEKYCNALMMQVNLHELKDVLFLLAGMQGLSSENLDLVFGHQNLYELLAALFYIKFMSYPIFNEVKYILAHPKPYCLAQVFSHLQHARLLDEATRSAIIASNHASLVSQEALETIWWQIPLHLLTHDHVQRLLTAAEHPYPMANLERIRNDIQGVAIEVRPEQVAEFNPRQSTHFASVHRSSTASALRLMTAYGKDLDLEEKIQEIKAYVNSLDEAPKHQAAKRCIERISADHSTLSASSGISIRELLVLTYLAIHDESKRLGSLEDVRALWVNGLYEIQRGYNLEAGQGPEEGEDKSICVGGTFNKLLEKLNGIHQDVEILYITQAGAALKFRKLAELHAKAYLQTQVSPQSLDDYQKTKALIVSMQEDGNLGRLWAFIKDEVKNLLWEEFSEIYVNPSQRQQFLDLIECGQDLAAPDLSMFETQLFQSAGYQSYLHEQARLGREQHSLWANRHSSPAAQLAFDKCYGMVVVSKI